MLAMVALLLVGGLGTRLWFLQGVHAADYQAAVTRSKLRTVYLPPERGRIFDSDARVLADNQRILTVTVERSVIKKAKNRNALFERLSGPLGVPVIDLQRRFDPCFGEPTIPKCTKGNIYDTLLPLPLKEGVDEDTVVFLNERREDYPGVDVVEDWRRVYPYAPLASHVVGYLGSINGDNLRAYLDQGYNRNERVGQFGVEASLEPLLHGSWGRKVFEIDAAGSIVRELVDQRVDPVAGEDVQLTIDLDLQQYAEQALETKLKERRDLPLDTLAKDRAPYNPLDVETNNPIDRVYKDQPEWVQHTSPAGAVVVLDHSNGQVIAMASYPTFDNRWQGSGITGDKYQQLFPKTKNPDQSILVNRAIQGRYNLGSTIKPFIAWSAMHSGLLDANTTFLDEGTYKLQTIEEDVCASGVRCVFKNATSRGTGKPTTYGPVTVESALAVSSDAFFYKLGEDFYRLGKLDDTFPLKEDLQRFGFGTETGIELPFEWGGRIPDDEVKAELVRLKVLGKNEEPRLLVGDDVQVAIGQGLMAATPLQLANAYATIANGGFLMKSQLVKAIYAPLTPDLEPAIADLAAGTVVESFDKPVIRDVLEMAETEIREPIVNGLRRVITGPGTEYPQGTPHSTTGQDLFKNYPSSAIPLAGKTGTVQGAKNYPWNDSSAFGAFSLDPANTYTVAAYLEKSGYGSKAAAPVVKCIFLALSDPTRMAPVLTSDTLDLNANVAAPPKQLADESCLDSAGGGGRG